MDQLPEDSLENISAHRSVRQQHYHFAHGILPANLLSGDSSLLNDLLTENWHSALSNYWELAGHEVDSIAETIDPAGLALNMFRREKRWYLLIRMPEVEGEVEAYYGVVVLDTSRKDWLFSKKPGLVRYFTLEKAVRLYDSETQGTMFCQWLLNRKFDLIHLNHGAGPPPEPNLLVEHIDNFLENRE